jgi:hypothetical protein
MGALPFSKALAGMKEESAALSSGGSRGPSCPEARDERPRLTPKIDMTRFARAIYSTPLNAILLLVQ